MLPINHGIVDTIEDFLQESTPASTGTQQKYWKLCLRPWIAGFPGSVFWLLLNLGHFSVVPFICLNKESRPKGPGFGLPPEGASIVFPLLRQSAGVMDWWSNGVMKGPIQVEIWAFAFANTPILQNSSQSLPTKPLNSDLTQRTRFSMLHNSTMSQKLAFSGKPDFNRQVLTHLENAGFYDSIAVYPGYFINSRPGVTATTSESQI